MVSSVLTSPLSPNKIHIRSQNYYASVIDININYIFEINFNELFINFKVNNSSLYTYFNKTIHNCYLIGFSKNHVLYSVMNIIDNNHDYDFSITFIKKKNYKYHIIFSTILYNNEQIYPTNVSFILNNIEYKQFKKKFKEINPFYITYLY